MKSLVRITMLIALTLSTILCSTTLYAQEVTTPIEQPRPAPVREYLSSFTAIKVDAPIKLTLIKVDATQAPEIIYDTKGVTTSRFTAEVNRRNNSLEISERSDSRRESITEVTVYFHTLTDISISKADVTIQGVLDTQLLDIEISNDSHFTAEIDVLDLYLTASGRSCILLSGDTRYQTVDISTAEYNATELESMSCVAVSSHNAQVKIDATERLECRTTTGGSIGYKSTPQILRTEVTLFGGEITQL